MCKYIRRFFYFFALLIWMLCTSASANTNYRITNYTMNVNVHSDGSASITEMLIYHFEGDYNTIFHEFSTDDLDGIEDINICIDGQHLTLVEQMTYENNTFTLTQQDDLLKLQIYSPGSGTRLVTCEYTMLGLAKRYEDTGVIYRKFIDETNSVRLENASVNVLFEKRAPLRAFVHGGMDMTHVIIEENRVQFGPAIIYSGDYVEIRLLFPTALIEDAPLNSGNVLNAHLASEELLDAQSRERAARIRTAKYVFVASYIAIFIVVWLLMVRKYHLKGKRRQSPNLHRITAFPAAFATVSINEAPDTSALAGTLIELIRKGILRMEATHDDLRLTRIAQNTDELYPHQRKVLEWLFEQNDSLMLSDLNANKNYTLAKIFEEHYTLYCDQVIEDMTDCKLLHRNEGLLIAANALIILLGVAGVGYILLAGTSIIPLGVALLLIMFLFVHLMSRIRTLTNEGEMLALAAKSLKEKEICPDDDIPAFLPYYAALSLSDSLVQSIENRRLDNSIWNEPDYIGSGWHLHMRHLSQSLHNSHNHNASVPASRATASDSEHKTGAW